jgi:NADPH:quinone reductase-like Zn-dependent oxidoreductase
MAQLTNKVIRFHEFGSAEVLKVENVDVREPGPGEVRIKVAAIGMNFAEAMWRQNQYIETAQLPSGLGYEVSGTIEKLGPGVTRFKAGEKVATFPAHNQGDYPAYGELAVMPVSSVARYPGKLSGVEAASYWTAYLTGYFAFFEIAKLAAGQTVLVTAGSSSTGHAAIQIAKAIGARVIATTRTSKKAGALREAGADVVVATEEEDLVQRVLAGTDGKGVEFAYDAVGGKQLSTLGQIIKPRGHLILYGLRSGGDLAAPLWDLWKKSIQFNLYTVFNFTGSPSLGLTRNEEAVERAIAFINGGIEKGLFKPKVDRTFKLDDVVAAHRYMEAGAQIGKIVITV